MIAASFAISTAIHSGWPVETGVPPSRANGIELVRGTGSPHSSGEAEDREDTFGSRKRSPRLRGGFKSQPGGYDPQRIRRFWRHYHGARPAKKEKPLERGK